MPTASTTQTGAHTSPAAKLPKGLYWRGAVLWANKTINGTRHQFSTETADMATAAEVYAAFLASNGVKTRERPLEARKRRPRLPKGLYWKGNVIWLSRVVQGKHHNLSTGTDDPRLAAQFLSDFNLKAFKGEKLGVKAGQRLTFDDLADRYLEQGKLNGLRAKTLQRYRAVTDHFHRFLQVKGLVLVDIRSFGADVIEDYKAWRAAQPVSRNGTFRTGKENGDHSKTAARTLQLEIQTVGTFFKYGVRVGLVAENPVSQVQSVRTGKKAPIFLETTEATQLLASAASYDSWAPNLAPVGRLYHDILLTYLKTGMRLEELRHLEWQDVDVRRGEITIRQEKTVLNERILPLTNVALRQLRLMHQNTFDELSATEKKAMIGSNQITAHDAAAFMYESIDFDTANVTITATRVWQSKTTGRIIPISPNLLPVLKQQPKKSNLVFPDPRTGGLWRFKILRIVKECVQHAKITKPIHTHSLRHTFATQLRKQGVALETIKELLGHADIRDTLIYAHFSPDEAKAAIPNIDVIDGVM